MEVTPARKLLSYFVSVMLLCFGKFSYDYHNHRPQLQSQELPFQLIVDSGSSRTSTPMTISIETSADEKPKLAKPVLAKKHYSKDVEVHAVGVHEAERTENMPTNKKGDRYGKIKVNVTTSSHPIILVLMSYEPELWELNVAKGTVIKQIILGGYYAQAVTGVDETIPLMVYTSYPSECKNCFRGDKGLFLQESPNTGVTNKIFEITGKKVTTFQGSDKGSVFNITDNTPKLEYQSPM